jgi:RNA polymerase sigma factor (sigma-70 family)
MRTEDGRIIQECLNGESEAFGMLVDKYREGIYAFVYNKLRNSQDAQDITQEVFLKAYKDLHSLKRWESFAFWLYRIAYSRCVEFLRSKSKRVDTDFIEDQDSKIIDAHSLDYYRENQISESVRDALDSLPEAHREALMLHYFGGMNSNEIANVLGTSPTAIRMRISRAREQMKEEILAMMGTAFEGQKLRIGFTFRVVEAIKQIKVQPLSPKTLPWGISLATGLIFTVLMFGQHIQINLSDISMGLPLPSDMKVLKIGEIPVDAVKVSTITSIGNKGDGKGFAPDPKGQENAFFMAPQGEGKWTEKAEMSTVRHLHSASVVDGKIYVFGGFDNASITPTVEEYDPILDKWTYKKNMPTLRYGHTATTINDKIYIIGGSNNFGASTIATVEEYDPKTDSWKEKADMPLSKYFHSAAVLHNKIYIIGGEITKDIASSSIYVYDSAIDQWEQKKDIPDEFQMEGSPAVADSNNIYILGGYNIKNGRCIDKVLVYDTLEEKWEKKAEIPNKRFFPTAAIISRDIYLIGGAKENSNSCLSIVEKYNIDEDKWEAKADMPSKRGWFSGSEAPVIDNQIYIIGGVIDVWENTTTKNEVYTPDIESKSVDPNGKLPKTWGMLKAK